MEGRLTAGGEAVPDAASPPAALQLIDVTKAFGANIALDSLSLEVPAGQIHALLGENGSGKSTLIKIVSGYHAADAGRVLVAGQELASGRPASSYAAGARFVHQDLGLVDSETVMDNIAIVAGYPTGWTGIPTRRLRARAARALALAGLDLDPRTPVGKLSPAERTGVAVARALAVDSWSDEAAAGELDSGGGARLLVLDEPTATLHENEVDRLLDIVRAVAARGVAVLYVTHRLDEVFQVCDAATVLRDGQHVITCPVSTLDRSSLVHHLVGRELDEARRETLALGTAAGRPVLKVENLVAGRLGGVSLTAQAGVVTGIAGVTGSGRDDVCPAVFGAIPRTGAVEVDGTPLPAGRPDRSMAAGMTFLTAERRVYGGMMNLTARENLTISDLRTVTRRGAVRRPLENAEVTRWFGALDVRPRDGAELPLDAFSGGNQQKVLFGKWLRREPTLMLLAEPTQGVDIGAKAQIHREIARVAAAGTAVVVSSSDIDELAAICHVVLVFRDGRIVARLSGDAVTVPAIVHANSEDEVPQ